MPNKISLGSAGLAYVEHTLKGGADWLPPKLLSMELSKLPLEQGEVYIWVPDDFLADHIHSFQDDVSGGGETNTEMSIQEISEHLAAHKRNIVVFEDSLRVFGDPWVDIDTRVFRCASEVFHLLTHADWEQLKKLELTMGMSLSDRAVIAMTVLPDTIENIDQWENVSSDFFPFIASSTTKLLIRAYDNRGWLTWSK